MNSHAFHKQLTAQSSCTGPIRFARACFLPHRWLTAFICLPKRVNWSSTFWGYLLINIAFSSAFYLPPPPSLKTLSSGLKPPSLEGYPKQDLGIAQYSVFNTAFNVMIALYIFHVPRVPWSMKGYCVCVCLPARNSQMMPNVCIVSKLQQGLSVLRPVMPVNGKVSNTTYCTKR